MIDWYEFLQWVGIAAYSFACGYYLAPKPKKKKRKKK